MRIICLIFGLLTCLVWGQSVDIVVFSYNRPLQLYAFLESLDIYGHNVGTVSVLYRTASSKGVPAIRFDEGYEIVKSRFPETLFFKQALRADDFKPLLMTILRSHCPHNYVAFAVDDLICKDEIDFAFCTDLIERERAEAFHLRMGTNLNYCYSLNQRQPLPPLESVDQSVKKWIFSKGVADWKYPHTVDMAIYRKHEVIHDFNKLAFSNPNSLEGSWTTTCQYNKTGLCYAQSRVVNFPLNLVNEVYNNRHMEGFPPEDLLTIFLSGKKMDLSPLHQIRNLSAHMDYIPTFVAR